MQKVIITLLSLIVVLIFQLELEFVFSQEN